MVDSDGPARPVEALRNAARGGQERFLVGLSDATERRRFAAARNHYPYCDGRLIAISFVTQPNAAHVLAIAGWQYGERVAQSAPKRGVG